MMRTVPSVVVVVMEKSEMGESRTEGAQPAGASVSARGAAQVPVSYDMRLQAVQFHRENLAREYN